MPTIAQNIAAIRAHLKPDTTLVAVIKNVTTNLVEEAIQAGITNIGENRIQEAESRIPYLKEKYPHIKVHMVGHLQTNKVKKAVQLFDMIQTVDSLHLAEAINRRAEKPLDVLVEIKTAPEESKSGISPENALELIPTISRLPNLKIRGLMTVAILSGNEQAVRVCFKTLRDLRDRLALPDLQYLSMGMTDDYQIALQEGANIVRIGTGIFGQRRRQDG